jgi:hypothetical protein
MTLAHRIRIAAAVLAAACLIPTAASAGIQTHAPSPRVVFSADRSPRISPRVNYPRTWAPAPRVFPRGFGYRFP